MDLCSVLYVIPKNIAMYFCSIRPVSFDQRTGNESVAQRVLKLMEFAHSLFPQFGLPNFRLNTFMLNP